jgi:hypothetical protein
MDINRIEVGNSKYPDMDENVTNYSYIVSEDGKFLITENGDKIIL